MRNMRKGFVAIIIVGEVLAVLIFVINLLAGEESFMWNVEGFLAMQFLLFLFVGGTWGLIEIGAAIWRSVTGQSKAKAEAPVGSMEWEQDRMQLPDRDTKFPRL